MVRRKLYATGIREGSQIPRLPGQGLLKLLKSKDSLSPPDITYTEAHMRTGRRGSKLERAAIGRICFVITPLRILHPAQHLVGLVGAIVLSDQGGSQLICT